MHQSLVKPGRNDPCPCGSGRKYKHCCLVEGETLRPDEVAWHRLRRAIDGLTGRLLDGATTHFGAGAIDEAWNEFNLWPDEYVEPFDPDSPHVPVFVAWYVFDWLPDAASTAVPPRAREVTAARAYASAGERRLEPLARRHVEAALEAPFSFHEVISIERRRMVRLRDAVIGGELEVHDPAVAVAVAAGDLLYAKAVPVDGIAVLEGCTPIALPPECLGDLIGLRARLSAQSPLVGHAFLRRHDDALRDFYLSIADELLYPELEEDASAKGAGKAG